MPVDVAAPSTQLLRRVNAGVILRVLRGAGVMTGTELMAASGLTRATVISVANDLVAMGWVREVEAQRQGEDRTKGRPARRFSLLPRAAHVVGVALEYGHITVVLSDLLGEIRARAVVPGPAGSFEETVGHSEAWGAALLQGVRQVLHDGGIRESDVLAATIGVPAPVGPAGEVSSAQLFWRSFDVRGTLATRYAWHIEVENDANLAVVAERWRGAGEGIDDLVVLLAGERLGTGVIEGGRLLRGRDGGFGELGFLDRVEAVGDTLGINPTASAWGRKTLSGGAPFLNELCEGDPERLTPEMILTAAADGDAAARDIAARLADRMAIIVAIISTFANPSVVVLDGGTAGAAEALLPAIAQRLPQLTSTPPRLATSSLEGMNVELGAVRRALDYVEDNALDLTLPPASA
ncbi:hypothetical protein BJH93_06970 [Kocuria polaris]|nr:hypothetical protein [Kocuria polaris]